MKDIMHDANEQELTYESMEVANNEPDEEVDELNDEWIPEEGSDVIDTNKLEIPDEFTPCTDKEAIRDEAILNTSVVAQELGVHRNVVINYTRDFYDYLAVYKNPANNRYKYTRESVKQLAFLMNDRLNNRRTIKEELEFIQTKTGGKVYNMAVNNTLVFETMFNAMQKNIIESNKQMIEDSTKAIIQQLSASEQLRIETSEREKELIQRMDRQEEKLMELIDEKNDEIERLREEIRERDEKQKKKKKFFPW